MKTFVLFLILLCMVFPLWGEYYYGDDPELLNIIHLSRRMGKVSPFSTFPVHGSDILDYALSLHASPASGRLNESDFSMLEDLIEKMEKQKEAEIRLTGGLEAAYEHRFSTGAFTIGSREMPNAEDVRHSFLDFDPVLSLHAGIGTFNGIWIAAQLDLRPSWENEYKPMNNFFTKVDITYDFINKGIFAWNGRYLNASISRDSVHWGNPEGSTFYPSSLLPHLDSLRMNVPLGPFSFDYLLATIMPKKAQFRDVDSAVKRDYPGVEPDNPLGPYFGFMRDQTDESPSIIFVAAHRFQWNFGRVKAGIGGTIVYARSNNQFLITDFLPIIIYHNSDSVPNNLALIADAEWTIFPGFSLSAMFGLDDLNAKALGLPDGQIPTIPGGILQLQYSRSSNKLFQSHMLEAGYTHYLWGNFAYTDKPDKWYGVYLARAIYRWTPNKYAVLLPLTSPYGPGALWGKLKSDFYLPALNINAGAELLVLANNTSVNLVDTPYERNDNLKGFNRLYFSLSLPFTYTWRFLEFSVSPALFWGSNGAAFECTLGIRGSLEGSRFFSVKL